MKGARLKALKNGWPTGKPEAAVGLDSHCMLIWLNPSQVSSAVSRSIQILSLSTETSHKYANYENNFCDMGMCPLGTGLTLVYFTYSPKMPPHVNGFQTIQSWGGSKLLTSRQTTLQPQSSLFAMPFQGKLLLLFFPSYLPPSLHILYSIIHNPFKRFVPESAMKIHLHQATETNFIS